MHPENIGLPEITISMWYKVIGRKQLIHKFFHGIWVNGCRMPSREKKIFGSGIGPEILSDSDEAFEGH